MQLLTARLHTFSCACKGLSNDDVGVPRNTVFQEDTTGSWVSKPAISFQKKKAGPAAAVERLLTKSASSIVDARYDERYTVFWLLCFLKHGGSLTQNHRKFSIFFFSLHGDSRCVPSPHGMLHPVRDRVL